MSDKQFNQRSKGGNANHANHASNAHHATDLHEMLANSKTFPTSVFDSLPQFLKKVCDCYSEPRKKDLALLGSLVVLSSCFPKNYTYYGKMYFPNLFGIVIAPPASGKGVLNEVRKLGTQLHRIFREDLGAFDEIVKLDLSKSSTNGDSEVSDKKKREKSFFLPADTSAASLRVSMLGNEGIGLIYETEIDTLANALGKEWGAFDDMLRKAFEHEIISTSRVNEGELSEINNSKLSVMLSGTPGQFKNLFPSTENGLSSRFFTYCFEDKSLWANMFGKGKEEEKIIESLSNELVEIYEHLNERSFEIKFKQTQIDIHYDFFSNMLEKIKAGDLRIEISSLKRLGVIAVRIAMIFTLVRCYEGKYGSKTIRCSTSDFNIAMEIIKVLIDHQQIALSLISDTTVPNNFDVLKMNYLKALPLKFESNVARKIAEEMNIKLRTASNYLSDFCKQGYLERIKKGHYRKKEDA
ncbi:YfjI family protein [Saprospiraceae bacterium]|nr:YfjI family protein [Saprospiraceae bacterium]